MENETLVGALSILSEKLMRLEVELAITQAELARLQGDEKDE